MSTRPTLAASLFLVLATVGGAASAEPLIPNLRVQRSPRSPWLALDGGRAVEVHASSVVVAQDQASWRLTVVVPRALGSIARATSPSVGVTSVSVLPKADGSSEVTMDVTAPRVCPTSENRQGVVLELAWGARPPSGAARFVVDHRCLLGDYLTTRDAASVVGILRRHWHDAWVDRLVANAPRERGDLDEEMSYLERAIGFGVGSVRPDPLDEAPGWDSGTAYVLSPEETATFGGDCEDYGVLTGLFLARRGFVTRLAMTPNHVWVVATLADGDHVVDLVDPQAHRPASSTFPISAE